MLQLKISRKTGIAFSSIVSPQSTRGISILFYFLQAYKCHLIDGGKTRQILNWPGTFSTSSKVHYSSSVWYIIDKFKDSYLPSLRRSRGRHRMGIWSQRCKTNPSNRVVWGIHVIFGRHWPGSAWAGSIESHRCYYPSSSFSPSIVKYLFIIPSRQNVHSI